MPIWCWQALPSNRSTDGPSQGSSKSYIDKWTGRPMIQKFVSRRSIAFDATLELDQPVCPHCRHGFLESVNGVIDFFFGVSAGHQESVPAHDVHATVL
jgi:hypothetical protein